MSTSGKLYLTAVTTLERLEIQYVPAKLSISRGAKVPDVSVVGRNNPLHHYTGGSTSLKLDLDFHSEEVGREDVIRKVKWLESLAYSDGFDSPPDRVKLTFGRLFRNSVWVVKNVSYDLSLFEEATGFLPKQAYVKIDLELDTRRNLKTEDVRWS